METPSQLCNLFSHSDTLLRDHLQAVGLRCYAYAESIRYELNEIGIESGKLGEILQAIGFCHDFGKGTSFFQKYLFCEDLKEKNRLKAQDESKHGLISAIFAYYIVREMVKDGFGDTHSLLPLTAFEIVRRHHGNLENVSDEVRTLRNDRTLDIINRQISEIDQSQICKTYDGLLPSRQINDFFDSYLSVIQEIIKCYRRCKPLLSGESGVLSAVFIQFCYSILISSDKEEASGLLPIRAGDCLPDDLVDRYHIMKGFSTSHDEISKIRKAIYEEVVHSALNNSLDNRILSLNAPTGTGKTLTGLSFALKIRKRINEKFGVLPRIIYSLPYISIIDQNGRIFEDVLCQDFTDGISHDILLKHHNLTDVSYTRGEDEFVSDEGLFMIESWESELIITTFVQFFHTLISNRNRSLRKFFRIANSVVLLDEVQTIPHKYWLLLRQLLIIFSRNFYTHFIFMTATQPFIFDPASEITELVSDKKRYFSSLNRITLFPLLERMCLSDFRDLLIAEINREAGRDFLIILNTINSCLSLFESLTKEPIPGVEYYYLSSHIIPKDRLERIKSIRERKGRKVIISTQLVEAGVDIDVDIVYRDFATLDSINQSAGRCNRHNIRENGIVKVVQLIDDERGHEYYSYIYSGDPMRTRFTMQVLNKRTSISEPEFLEVINSYYQLMKDGMSNDESLKILSFFSDLNFNEFKEFKIIPEKYPKIDVFVCVDEFAESLWIKYQEIRLISDRLEKKRAYLEIKRDLHQYVISVPRKYQDGAGYSENTHFGYISRDEIEQGLQYNRITGFVGYRKSYNNETLVL